MLGTHAVPAKGGDPGLLGMVETAGFGPVMTGTGFFHIGAFGGGVTSRDPVEFDPTGHGAYAQAMLEAWCPTLREDTEVSVLKGIHEGIVGAARRDRDSRAWERLCRRWAPKH